MKDYRDPYLAVQNPRMMMKGKDAPRSTVFGALGIGGGAGAFVGGGSKALGGLVADTKTKAKAKDMTVSDKHAYKMEHGHYGKDATKIPAAHWGQVPYAGFYMGAVGKRL
jgi:hypothetical protein